MTGVNEQVEVIIEEIDMPLFKAFVLNKRQFEILLRAGVFELTHGKATINKHEGHIQSVHVDQMTYKYVGPRP